MGGNIAVADSSLVGHWKFDNNLVDSSGNGRDLTATVGPTYGVGNDGQAIFDTDVGYSTQPFLTGTVLTQEFRILFWFKADSGSPNPADTIDIYVVNQANNRNFIRISYAHMLGTNYTLVFKMADAVGGSTIGIDTIASIANGWRLFEASADGTVITLSIDGVPQSTSDRSILAASPFEANGQLIVSTVGAPGLDDLKIHNTAA